jgi:S-DNA-T family DNA segregation ATPase FtsK/SpoIIIE
MSRCGECGYNDQELSRAAAMGAIRALAGEHEEILTTVPAPRLRAHQRPGSWSALEYGCHVRDVLRFQRERVELAQEADNPVFVSMRRDERAVSERYNDQDPRLAGAALTARAGDLTLVLSRLPGSGWLRTGLYPWPVPEFRSVEWVARRTAHELAHHLFDVRRLLGEPG